MVSDINQSSPAACRFLQHRALGEDCLAMLLAQPDAGCADQPNPLASASPEFFSRERRERLRLIGRRCSESLGKCAGRTRVLIPAE
jgi:hypothetical protein